MMDAKQQFDEFLKGIRLQSEHIDELKTGHTTLRSLLSEDANLSHILVSDFLQGSYRRHTAIRPTPGKHSDVDIVVVTNISEADYSPQKAMSLFEDFLNKHYEDKWRYQGRSIGIKLTYIDMDVVLTSAPSEATEQSVVGKSVRDNLSLGESYDYMFVEHRAGYTEPLWKSAPLRIPDREAECWDDTDPLEQIRRTWNKNKETNGHYVNVVKALKWWRRNNSEPKYPRSYPLEHLIYLSCPGDIDSIAEGVTLSLEGIVQNYAEDVAAQRTPFVGDHGVPTHNVLARVTPEDFAKFYRLALDAAAIARTALEATTVQSSCDEWRKLFEDFPAPPSDGGSTKGGYDPPSGPSTPSTDRFA